LQAVFAALDPLVRAQAELSTGGDAVAITWGNQMRLRLNGWQRIGIVLSVIWFIGFAGYIWNSSVQNNLNFYSYQLESCYTLLNLENDSLQYKKEEDREKQRTVNWTKYENCQNKAKVNVDHQNETLYHGIPLLFTIDFGTVLFGWLVVWFGIGISRWKGRFSRVTLDAVSAPDNVDLDLNGLDHGNRGRFVEPRCRRLMVVCLQFRGA